MASTVLDPVADALVSVIDDLGLSPTMTGEKWDPGPTGLDSVPAGVVGIPIVERNDVDTGESQIGTDDWRIEYPVILYWDLSEAAYSQAQAVEGLEAFIAAVDADQTLNGATFDARVIYAEPEEIVDEARPLLSYRCRVAVLKLV